MKDRNVKQVLFSGRYKPGGKEMEGVKEGEYG
jgi:hypothetical protein